MTSSTSLVAVVAMASNRVIGDGDDLLWHLPGDLKRVKALTMGCPLIMGRKTWDSIGRPLPGRASIVMTRQSRLASRGRDCCLLSRRGASRGASWLEAAQEGDENRIILFGGGQIYEAGLPQCDVIELTEVDLAPEGPAKFPELDLADWQEVSREEVTGTDDVPAHRFLRYERA